MRNCVIVLILGIFLVSGCVQQETKSGAPTPLEISDRVISEKLIVKNDSLPFDSLKISLDNRRVAYVAKEGRKWFVVVDGKEEKKYNSSIVDGTLIFSPDSKRVVYAAKEGNKMFVIVDGKEEKQYDGIGKGYPIFSPNSKHVVYAAYEENKWFLVVDGIEEKKYDTIMESSSFFSPDSKQTVYTATEGGKMFVVVNGKEEKRYDQVGVTPVFSPDGKRLIYGARLGNKSFMVVDGKEEKQYDDIPIFQTPIFSPDSRRLAYIAHECNELDSALDGIEKYYCRLMVVDGKEEKKYYEFQSNAIFSPDSKRVAYAAKLGDLGGVVVVDGKEEKKFIMVSGPKFSSDSRTVAYVALNFTNFTSLKNQSIILEIAYFLVANGKEGKKYYQKDGNTYDIIMSLDQYGREFTFDSADSLHYLVLKENGIYLVEEKISDVS